MVGRYRGRWIVLAMIAVVVVGWVVLYPYAETQAFAPALVLAPEAIAVFAGLLTAAGITFVTDDAATGAVYQLWESASEALRGVVEGCVDGVVMITSELWSELRQLAASVSDGQVAIWVSDGFTFALDSGSTGIQKTWDDSRDYGRVAVDCEWSSDGGGGGPEVLFKGSDGKYYYVWLGWFSGVLQMRVMVDGYTRYQYAYDAGVRAGAFEVVVGESSVDVYRGGTVVWSYAGWGDLVRVLVSKPSAGSIWGDVTWAQSGSVTLSKGVNYDDTVYLDSPEWDLSGKEVTVPTSLDGVVGKDAGEVVSGVTDVVNPPDVGTETGTVTGWLSNIYNKLAEGLSSISGAMSQVVAKVTALPGEIVQGVASAISTAFTPTLTMEAVIEEISNAADDRVPFVWFDTWADGAGVGYGNEELRFEWQPGLISETVGVTIPGIADVRGLSTLLILAGSCWAAYGEIRRWLG